MARFHLILAIDHLYFASGPFPIFYVPVNWAYSTPVNTHLSFSFLGFLARVLVSAEGAWRLSGYPLNQALVMEYMQAECQLNARLRMEHIQANCARPFPHLLLQVQLYGFLQLGVGDSGEIVFGGEEEVDDFIIPVSSGLNHH